MNDNNKNEYNLKNFITIKFINNGNIAINCLKII